MALLNSSELAQIRMLVHEPSMAAESTLSVYRSPAPVDGKVGPPVLITTGILGRIRPMTDRVSRLIPSTEPISAARFHWELKVLNTIDIRVGDELRSGATRYKVEGFGRWHNVSFCALSEIKGAL